MGAMFDDARQTIHSRREAIFSAVLTELVRSVLSPYIATCAQQLTGGDRIMSAFASVEDQNRELARRINEEARSNPASPYAGKFVGIANGQVVAVSDDLDEVVRHLRAVEPDPQKAFCLEAGLDYNQVQDIWSAP